MSETQQRPRQDGMQRIPFPTESYQHPSLPLSAKRLLNCFAEQEPNDARAPVALRTVPGLVFREALGGGPVKSLNTDFIGGYYAVSGGQAFRHTPAGTVFIGNVGNETNPAISPRVIPQRVFVTIAVSPDYAVICVPPNLYVCTHTGTLTPVDTSEFQGGGAGSVTYIDGYFVVTQWGVGNKFQVSALRDPYTWDALMFASAESINNVLFRALTHNGELWLMGAAGYEVWYDAGAGDFPFRRQSSGSYPFGFAPRSLAQLDSSIWGVSYDGCIYRTSGYKPQRVSTHAVEAIIEGANPDFATGLAYMQEGHAHYVVTLQDLGRTLAYDAATKQWHDRSSSADGSGPWRALVAGRIGEGVYVGDAAGRLYTLDTNGTMDNGALIYQSVTLPPLQAITRLAFCARAEIEMEAPPDTDVTLTWSDDGGRTFGGGPRVMSAPNAQALRRRLVTTRLGSFRQRVFRIETHGRTTLYAMAADNSAGAH